MVTADQSHSANTHTEHGHHEDRPELQHHFATPEQQFDSSKFGMWLFLATELLLFGGLFCVYVVYRVNHPDIFHYAHHFLDTSLGATNTAVLIFSSLTMAWAVRAAQLNKKTMLITLLSITVLCGFVFMGIKYVEYSSKIKYGLTWGEEFNYAGMDDYLESHHQGNGEEHDESEMTHTEAATTSAEPHEEQTTQVAETELGQGTASQAAPETETVAAQNQSAETQTAPENQANGQNEINVAEPIEYSQLETTAIGPTGIHRFGAPPSMDIPANEIEDIPENVHIFFGIYYCMTGLHAIHVIVGLIAITWLITKAIRGQFSHNYYTPVDLVGLYWHVVDLIWIYLFPLLYLIE